MNIGTPSQPYGFASIAITKKELLFKLSKRKEFLFLDLFTHVLSLFWICYCFTSKLRITGVFDKQVCVLVTVDASALIYTPEININKISVLTNDNSFIVLHEVLGDFDFKLVNIGVNSIQENEISKTLELSTRYRIKKRNPWFFEIMVI